MVYGIVKQNDGFIKVYSKPGLGTTFKIFLPKHEREFIATEATGIEDIPRSRGETVLLVEDEQMIMNIAQKMLEDLGYKVLAARMPQAALHMAKEIPDGIHLLLTDVVMPEMNGRDLAEKLQPIHRSIKTLYISGYTSDVIANRGVLDEGVNFIQKPFTIKQLADKVRRVLDQC